MTQLTRGRSLRPLPVLALILGGCAAAIPFLEEMAAETGRSLLRNVADENFEPEYVATLDKLLDVLSNKGGEYTPPYLQGDPTPEATPARPVTEGPAPTTPIELEVGVFCEAIVGGRSVPVPLHDGDVIRDGGDRSGTHRDDEGPRGAGKEKPPPPPPNRSLDPDRGQGDGAAGDNLKIRFKTNVDCYVYAVWIDATAWATPIFPRSSTYTHANPVQAGRDFDLPSGSDWFYLDEYRGVETLYFLASHTPIPDLDQLIADLVGRERPSRAVGEMARVTDPNEITRGLLGTRPSTAANVQGGNGSPHSLPSETFLAQFEGSDVVVTRWFRHE